MNIPIESLTPEERAELDAAVQAIPADQTPLFNAITLMHRHDWNQLINVIGGYQQMLDVRYEQEASARKALADTIVRDKNDSDRRFAVLERRIARLEQIEERERRARDDFDEGHP